MADATPDLRAFTLEFFTFFQATVRRLDNRKQGALEVLLPHDLAAHFGAESLKLTFQHTESSDYELVAHGSRVFDRMLSYVERRGALTVQNLPVRHTGSEELMAAVRPVNAGIGSLRMQEQMQTLFVFNWRITYRADDKREELHTVVLDEAGERIPLCDEPNPSARAVELDALFADAAPPPPERDAEGRLVPPRLTPMTQLVRLAEIARKYATYHADLRCISHESEILPRLYQTLNRLTTYYGQQIQEVYEAHDPTGEKRLVLEQDLERKIAEEVENHRLRVQVTLFSYAMLNMPVAIAEIDLSDGRQTATIQVARNRYTGNIERPPCYVCGGAMETVTLDRAGHVVCNDCVQVCGSCNELVCDECGVAPCPVCERENCEQCGQACWACGERACIEHISRCPVCGDSVCHACQAECAACEKRQCRSHLRADAVAVGRGEESLICGECAVRCPGCNQYSAEVGICAASGQRFCEACLAPCAECGGLFGTGFYRLNPVNGLAYCENCLVECPGCLGLTPQVLACPTCDRACCYSCGAVCEICRQPFCAEHSRRFGDCGHVVCCEHEAVCVVCAAEETTTEVCPACRASCAICETHFCAAHSKSCLRCGVIYCRNCVNAEGECTTCAGIKQSGAPVDIDGEPCVQDARVGGLSGAYHWMRAGNARYVIYRGVATLMGEVTVSVERATDQVISVRKVNFIDALRSRFVR